MRTDLVLVRFAVVMAVMRAILVMTGASERPGVQRGREMNSGPAMHASERKFGCVSGALPPHLHKGAMRG